MSREMKPMQRHLQTPGTSAPPSTVASVQSPYQRVMQMQQNLGNRAVAQLFSGMRPMQLKKGDAYVVTGETRLYQKREENGKAVVRPVSEGEICTDLQNAASANSQRKWTKVRMSSDQSEGYLMLDFARHEPALSIPKDSKINRPDKMKKLTDELFPNDGPSSEDIHQGGLGDCWLLSPLAALAETPAGKAAIQNMITKTKSGYGVTFYIPKENGGTEKKTVQVSPYFAASDENEVMYAQLGEHNALWPLVIEKAFAQVNGSFEEIDGGFVSAAYLAVTGQYPEGYSQAGNARDLGEDRAEAVSDQGLMEKLIAAKAAEKAVSVWLPPKTEKAKAAFQKPLSNYLLFIPHFVDTAHVKLTYTAQDGGQEVLNAEQVVCLNQEEQGGCFIVLEDAKEPNMDLEAEVEFRVVYEIGENNRNLDGGHVYYLSDVDPDDQDYPITIRDPRYPDENHTWSFTADDLLGTFNAHIFVG